MLFISDGLKFFLSDNNVILSSGDKDGIIAPKYFSKVIDYRLGKFFISILVFYLLKYNSI